MHCTVVRCIFNLNLSYELLEKRWKMFNKIIQFFKHLFHRKKKYNLEQIFPDDQEYPIYEWLLEEQTTVIDE